MLSMREVISHLRQRKCEIIAVQEWMGDYTVEVQWGGAPCTFWGDLPTSQEELIQFVREAGRFTQRYVADLQAGFED